MSLLTDVRGDTSNILTDWEEAIVFQRKTATVSTAGEESGTWSTSLSTKGDVQWDANKRLGDPRMGGFEYSPSANVFIRHGLDVKEGDRTHLSGMTLYVQEVRRDPDKLQLVISRRSRDNT